MKATTRSAFSGFINPKGKNLPARFSHVWKSAGIFTLTLRTGETTIGIPMLAYLSGSIEYSPDQGKAWRAKITPGLRSLGWEVYDPAQDQRKNLSEEEAREFRQWKRSDPQRFRRTMRKIIAWDLDWIERSDLVVCYWDEFAGRGAGTQGELTFAHRAGVPVYLVSALPPDAVSGWILGCATEVFADFDQLQAFLRPAEQPAKTSARAVAARAADGWGMDS